MKESNEMYWPSIFTSEVQRLTNTGTTTWNGINIDYEISVPRVILETDHIDNTSPLSMKWVDWSRVSKNSPYHLDNQSFNNELVHCPGRPRVIWNIYQI